MKTKISYLPSGETLTIRIGEPDDGSAYVDFLHQISGESDYLAFGVGEISIFPEEQKKIIQKINEENNQLFLIAEVNGKIVGNLTFRGGVRVRTKHVGEFGISVLKEYWGFGIGKVLIEVLLGWAAEGKIIKKINLKVRTDNHSAIRLYKKLGFQEEGFLTREFLIHGEFFDCIQMGLKID